MEVEGAHVTSSGGYGVWESSCGEELKLCGRAKGKEE